MSNGVKILLTGGAGFIGSHIQDRYLSLGHRVVVVDDLSFGFKKNINPKAKFYKVDIRNKKSLEKIFKKEKPDIINHQAALASVIISTENPQKTLESNVLGTYNLLDLGKKYKIKKFIFASTGGAIYGNAKKIPAPETTLPSPLSPYGLSKLLAEECVKYFAKSFGINFTILRYANIYGPRQNEKGEAGVVAIFSGLMNKGKRPTIFGSGNKTRDYVFVDDVVKANVSAIKRGKNCILNIGSGKETKDIEVFKAIKKAVGKAAKNIKPIFVPVRPGEVYRTSLDSSLAKRILGWKARTSFKEGIEKTVKYY